MNISDEWLREPAVLVTSRLTGDQLLLAPELPPEPMVWADRIVHEVERRRAERDSTSSKRTLDGVLVDQLEHSHATTLGPALVGLHAWDPLKLDKTLAGVGFNPKQWQTA